MAVVVVGGQTRGVGKTGVVCGLIAALKERDWTAVKLSAHGHSEDIEVHEETDSGSGSDSARYLAAGAVRSFYLSAPEGGLWRAVPKLLDILAGSSNAMVESTSVLGYLRPELALAVIDPAVGEVKASLRTWSEQFHVIVAPEGIDLPEMFRGRKRFDFAPPVYASPELVEFVLRRL